MELTPKYLFNITIICVGGDELEVPEQNRRIVEYMDNSDCAINDDFVACRDILMTQFALIELEQETTG